MAIRAVTPEDESTIPKKAHPTVELYLIGAFSVAKAEGAEQDKAAEHYWLTLRFMLLS